MTPPSLLHIINTVSKNYLQHNVSLIRLHRTVNVVHEGEGAVEANKSEHDEERIRDDAHVTKVEGQLQHAVHVGAVREVVEGVHEDKQTGGATVDEGGPPPSVVLAGQLEVQQGDGYERGHNHQQNERNEQNAKEGVDLVAPDGREDIVQLNVDRRKGKEACHEDLHVGLAVPAGDLGHLARYLVGATRGLEFFSQVAAHHSAHHGQGKMHE